MTLLLRLEKVMYISMAIVFVQLSSKVAGGGVKIITVVFGDILANGYHVQVSATDVAIQHARERYPVQMQGVTSETIWTPGVFVCQQQDTAALMPMIAMRIEDDIRSRNDSTILIGSEFNVPMISIDATGAILTTARFPTLVAFPSIGISDLVDATKVLLEMFSWTTLSVLCGDLTPGVIDDFVQGVCRVMQAVIGNNPAYRATFSHFETRPNMNQTANYREMLRQCKDHSRVVVILPRTMGVLREFMVLAHRLAMTDGDYVFLALVVPVPQGRLGAQEMDWMSFDDTDQEAFIAFQSLILMKNPSTNWTNVPNLVTEMTNRSCNVYNRTFTQEETELGSDYMVDGYEAVTSMLEVLAQSFSNETVINGREFRGKLVNRTFELPTRSFFVGPKGMRVCDVVLARLNPESEKMETAWFYNSATKVLRTVSSLAHTWRNRTGPPPNIPACGYTGYRCIGGLEISSVIGASVGTTLLLLTVCALVYWYLPRLTRDMEQWWIIDIAMLSALHRTWNYDPLLFARSNAYRPTHESAAVSSIYTFIRR